MILTGESRILGKKNQPQCQFTHQKSQVDWRGFHLGSPQWEGEKLSRGAEVRQRIDYAKCVLVHSVLFCSIPFYSVLSWLPLFILSPPLHSFPLLPCLRFVFPSSILSSRSPSFHFLLSTVLSCCLVLFCPILRCDFSPTPHCPVWSSEQHCLYFEMFKPLKCLNRWLVESERDVGRNRRINWQGFFFRTVHLRLRSLSSFCRFVTKFNNRETQVLSSFLVKIRMQSSISSFI